MTGRLADGWVPSLRGDLQPLAEGTARLDDAAADAGRDPAAIRRVLNVNGVITERTSEGLLHGPADQWIDELTEIATDYGFDTFVLWTEGRDYERFAAEIAPAVREQVAAERNG